MNYRETCPCGAKLELEDVYSSIAAETAKGWRDSHQQTESHRLWAYPKLFLSSEGLTTEIAMDDDGVPDLGNYDSEDE